MVILSVAMYGVSHTQWVTERILDNQEKILANQKKIMVGQRKLYRLVGVEYSE